MKKLLLICAISSLSLISCAQGVNLLATKVSATPGSLLYVGSDQLLKPLYAPNGPGTYLLAVTNGQYTFMTLANAAVAAGIKGDKGDKGDTGLPGAAGPQGIQGLPGAKGDVGSAANIPPGKAGQVLRYVSDNQIGAADADLSLAAPGYSGLTTPVIVSTVTATIGGQYTIGGYLYLHSTDNTGYVTLQWTYTTPAGDVRVESDGPVYTTSLGTFPITIINCKAGSIIKVETVFSDPAMQVVYDTGVNIHEK